MMRPSPIASVDRDRHSLRVFPKTTPRRAGDPTGFARALILAGGDGVRLRALSRELAGDDRPKQFVAVVGRDPLLAQTTRRAGLLVPGDRMQIVLTRSHEPYYREIVAWAPASSLLIQPENRGTAAAVLYALLKIARQIRKCPVVILPSDHWVSDDAVFTSHVSDALGVVQERPDLVVLLGIVPNRPESGFGWVEPSEPISGEWPGLCRVGSFLEKPPRVLAGALAARGFLWNSFVVVGQTESLLTLFALALPALVDSFLPVWSVLGTRSEEALIERLYRSLPAADFSRDVLGSQPEMLAVLTVDGVSWEDLGDPEVVRALRRHTTGSHASQPARG
jgi:mannose-1-phosphate guanylyltransferase